MNLSYDIIIFIKINPESLLIFLEIFNFLENSLFKIKIIPILENNDMLSYFTNCLNKTENIFFLIIIENYREIKEFLMASKDSIQHQNKNNLVFHEISFGTKQFNFLNDFFLRYLRNKTKDFVISVIDVSSYFKKNLLSYFYLPERVLFDRYEFQAIQHKIWFRAIMILHLYLEKKLTHKVFSFYIKKISNLLQMFYGKQSNLVKDNENKKMISLKELPMYFLYHSPFIISFLNTPSLIIRFELWKTDGFYRILEFFEKISICKEDIDKLWTNFDNKKKIEIRGCFLSEAKKYSHLPTLIYIFKKQFKNMKNQIDFTSLDLVLALRSKFDLSLRYLFRRLTKKKFWLNLIFLTETKILKKFIRKGKQTQQFISNISRIILSKKLFVSLKKMRIVYMVGSDDITYRMLSGLSGFLISVFNKNKLKKKLLLLIIKEQFTTVFFISHQNKNSFDVYENFFLSNRFVETIKSIRNTKNTMTVKCSKTYEKELLTSISMI